VIIGDLKKILGILSPSQLFVMDRSLAQLDTVRGTLAAQHNLPSGHTIMGTLSYLLTSFAALGGGPFNHGLIAEEQSGDKWGEGVIGKHRPSPSRKGRWLSLCYNCCNRPLAVLFLFLGLCHVYARPLLFLEVPGHGVRIPGVCLSTLLIAFFRFLFSLFLSLLIPI